MVGLVNKLQIQQKTLQFRFHGRFKLLKYNIDQKYI